MSITATDGVRVLTISNNDQTANVVRAAEAAEASEASAADALTYAERAEAAAAETTSEGLLEAIDQAESARDDAQAYASNAADSATDAAASAETASTIADEINRIEAAATTLPAGSSATVSYDPASSPIMTFNIPRGDQGIPGPQGDQGDPGQSFTLKATVADETALNAVPSPSENDGRIVESTNTVWIYSDSAWSDTGANIVGPAGPAGTTDYEELINVPSTFPPSAHNHDTVYVKLTGSTMSGPLAFSRASQQMITLNNTGNANPNPTTIRETNAGDFGVAHGLDNNIALTVEPAGTTITNSVAAVTKEKGDARYLQLSNYLDVDRTFATVAEMVASTKNTVGDYVRTLGYLAAGDGGGNDYQIVAAATATADGGSYINLTGISGQAKGLFPGNVVHARKFGPPATGDASAEINAASAYAVALQTATGSAVKVVLEGYFEIADPIYLAERPAGGDGENIHIDTSAAFIQVIAGGDFDSTPNQSAVIIKAKESLFNLGIIACGRLAGGILFDDCTNSICINSRVERFIWRGWQFDGNCAGFKLSHPTGMQYAQGDSGFETDANLDADGVYINGRDLWVGFAHVGYCGRPIVFTGDAVGSEIVGCHPYNGNATGSGPRLHPFCIVNESTSIVRMTDCYPDNGYVHDESATMLIKGGRHYVGSAATLTHPYTRIKLPTDAGDAKSTVSDFDSSLGFYTGSWSNDFSGGISDIDYTIASSRDDQRVTEYYRRKTWLITDSSNTVDLDVVKQGDGAALIANRYRAGTSNEVTVTYGAGAMTVVGDGTTGTISVANDVVSGMVGNGDALELWSNDRAVVRIETDGDFRPDLDDNDSCGTASFRWSSTHTVDLVADGAVSLSGLPTYADNTAATGGGLVAGDVYKTATGELRIVV